MSVSLRAATPRFDVRVRGARFTPARVTVVLVVFFLAVQVYAAWVLEHLGFPEPRLQWDARAYIGIAVNGYPTGGSPGSPPEGFQSYSFHPLFPAALRVLGALPGLSPALVAPWLNLSLATVAVAVLAHWLATRVGKAAAAVGVVALSVWPASPSFQLGYTEGAALLLLVLSWRFVDERRYLPAAVAIGLLSLTRPVAVPLAVAMGVVAVAHWRRDRDRSELRGLVGVVLTAAVATVAWPVYAGIHSGDPLVYFTSHAAFAKSGAPTSPLLWALQVPLIGVLLVLVLTMTMIIGTRLMPDPIPLVLRVWVVVYPIYLAVGSLITASMIRYYLLVFPAALLLVPVARHRMLGPVLLVVALMLGVVSISWWCAAFVPPSPDGFYP